MLKSYLRTVSRNFSLTRFDDLLNLNSSSFLHPNSFLKFVISWLIADAISGLMIAAPAITKAELLAEPLKPGSPESSMNTSCFFILLLLAQFTPKSNPLRRSYEA